METQAGREEMMIDPRSRGQVIEETCTDMGHACCATTSYLHLTQLQIETYRKLGFVLKPNKKDNWHGGFTKKYAGITIKKKQK